MTHFINSHELPQRLVEVVEQMQFSFKLQVDLVRVSLLKTPRKISIIKNNSRTLYTHHRLQRRSFAVPQLHRARP